MAKLAAHRHHLYRADDRRCSRSSAKNDGGLGVPEPVQACAGAALLGRTILPGTSATVDRPAFRRRLVRTALDRKRIFSEEDNRVSTTASAKIADTSIFSMPWSNGDWRRDRFRSRQSRHADDERPLFAHLRHWGDVSSRREADVANRGAKLLKHARASRSRP